MKPRLRFGFVVLVAVRLLIAEAKCNQRCDLALASYYVWQGSNLSFISTALAASAADIISYNKDKVPNQNFVRGGDTINVPFTCGCITDSNNNEFLGHVFKYTVMQGDTYDIVAQQYYSNLTTAQWLQNFNSYNATNIPDTATLNVTVNCSCGDSSISKDYGLFITYPLRASDTLESIASAENISAGVLQQYNPGVNFSQGSGLVYIPGKGCVFQQLCGR